MYRNMCKSRHVYLSKILLIHNFLGHYFLLSLIMGTYTLLAVKRAESVMQKLTFDFYHELAYYYNLIVFLVKIAKVKYFFSDCYNLQIGGIVPHCVTFPIMDKVYM